MLVSTSYRLSNFCVSSVSIEGVWEYESDKPAKYGFPNREQIECYTRWRSIMTKGTSTLAVNSDNLLLILWTFYGWYVYYSDFRKLLCARRGNMKSVVLISYELDAQRVSVNLANGLDPSVACSALYCQDHWRQVGKRQAVGRGGGVEGGGGGEGGGRGQTQVQDWHLQQLCADPAFNVTLAIDSI